jgi:predicted nuclease of predicted toxin-antitoxin system
MTRFLVDEDFNNVILRGIRRRRADLDAARVQDVGLLGADDDTVLATAAAEGRMVLTHDVEAFRILSDGERKSAEPIAARACRKRV